MNFEGFIIEDFDGAPTDEELQLIADMLPYPLPSTYAEFLSVANGAYFAAEIEVKVGDRKEIMSFCETYSTKEAACPSGESYVLDELAGDRKYRGIPDYFLPIARDGGSSILYLDVRRESSGTLWAFIDGLPGWTGLTSTDTFIKVADSFSDYLSKAYPDPEYEG